MDADGTRGDGAGAPARRLTRWLPAVVLVLGCGAPASRELGAAIRTVTPVGAAVDRWLVSPARADELVAIWGDRAFRRDGPYAWTEVDAASVRNYLDAETTSDRLATGAVVLAAVLSNGLHVAATESGMVEAPGGLSAVGSRTHAAPLPLRVRDGSFAPTGPDSVILAGDPAGLFRCETTSCTRIEASSFRHVRWFADDTWILGDSDGYVWRHDAAGFHRQRVADGPLQELDGVPDGGPRFVTTKAGETFRSEDHGLSWRKAPGPAGRIGSGGVVASAGADGRLTLTRLDEVAPATVLDLLVPPGVPMRWASPLVLVVERDDAVEVIEPRRSVSRRFNRPAGTRLLDATVFDGAVYLLLTDPRAGASVYAVSERATLSDRSVLDSVSSAWPWLVTLLGVLAVVAVGATRGPLRARRY